MRPTVLMAALAVLCAWPGHGLSARAEPQRPEGALVASWLPRYAAGEHQQVIADISQVPGIAPLVPQIERRVREFVGRPPDGMAHPRLAAATFLLDLSRARLETDWMSVRSLVELGCSILRDGGPPGPPESAWHLAALSLALGAADTQLLLDTGPIPKLRSYAHLNHSLELFPEEPRFALAVVVARELNRTDTEFPRDRTWVATDQLAEMKVGGQLELSIRNGKRKALENYAALESVPAISSEVHLRMGHLHFQLHNDDEALRHLTMARESPDPSIVHLAHLLTGRLHQRRGEHALAETSLRTALEVWPGAQSAVQVLATDLFLSGRGEEAYLLVDEMFRGQARASDPWRLFGYGDFRFWPERIARLRGAWQ